MQNGGVSPAVCCRNRLMSDRQADVFQFHVVIDTMGRSFAAKARLLDATKRGHLVRDQAGVYANHTVFKLFLNPRDAANVTSVEIGCQTEDRVIRAADDTIFGLASYFYARDIGRITRVQEQLEYGMVGVNTGLISNE